jgi:hypothetical protein
MEGSHNVGKVDSVVRLALGVACLGALGYHFLRVPILPPYGLIAVVILIPFFLKTGATRVCPAMKALGVSTNQ